MKIFISILLIALPTLPARGEYGTTRIEPAFERADADYVNMLTRRKITLSLAKMSLESVPTAITNAPFTEIDLSNNRLTEFPAELITLTNSLKVLRLNGNQIKTLPAEIGCFKKLDALYLSGCPLETLPPEICELKNLSALMLSNCHLTSLPLGMENLTKNTCNFKIAGNQLQNLPEGFLFPKKLTNLDLSNNQFSAIPPGLAPGIGTLDINNNCLKGVTDESLSSLNALGCLRLNNNRIERIELRKNYPKLFRLEVKENALRDGRLVIRSAPSLKYIELSSNHLKTLPECLFILPSLKSITIRGNYISNLTEITGCRNLEHLDLSGNNVSFLPDALGKLPKLKTLRLKGNPVSTEEIQEFKERFPHIQISR